MNIDYANNLISEQLHRDSATEEKLAHMPVQTAEDLAELAQAQAFKADYDEIEAGVEALKVELGDKQADNMREHMTNRLLLNVIKGETPDPDDVEEFERAIDAFNAAPEKIKNAVLAK